ncbi:MAG: hypothetical protein U0V56_06200 [Actinomycetota bacterium]
MTQAALRRGPPNRERSGANHVVVLVQRLDAATVEAIGYVKSIRPTDVRAVHPSASGAIPREMRERWGRLVGDVRSRRCPRGNC